MDKKLQDLAWQCLPLEVKKEVKRLYKTRRNKRLNEVSSDFIYCLVYIFGKHNLTSDAEGEEDEMLHVSRKRVQEIYSYNEEILSHDPAHSGAILLKKKLADLFGSKCLPEPSKLQASCRQVNVDSSHDNVDSSHGNVDSLEPKPTEPKFRVGDKVTVTAKSVSLYPRPGIIAGQTEIPGQWVVLVEMASGIFPYNLGESELEPYTDPGKEVVKMRLTTSKVSVYLATKEEDEEFRLLLHENGFRWNTGDPLINIAYWNSYIEKSKIHYFHPDKTVTYWGDKTSETLTFSEFKKQFFEEKPRELSQETANCDYPVPDRLHIAAMAMQGILSNTDRLRKNVTIGSGVSFGSFVARDALRYADALIAESHK
jgi:hypothetical protein